MRRERGTHSVSRIMSENEESMLSKQASKVIKVPQTIMMHSQTFSRCPIQMGRNMG